MSPFRSRSQVKWAFANKQPWAAKWEDMTPNINKLPQHVTKPKKKTTKRRKKK